MNDANNKGYSQLIHFSKFCDNPSPPQKKKKNDSGMVLIVLNGNLNNEKSFKIINEKIEKKRFVPTS